MGRSARALLSLCGIATLGLGVTTVQAESCCQNSNAKAAAAVAPAVAATGPSLQPVATEAARAGLDPPPEEASQKKTERGSKQEPMAFEKQQPYNAREHVSGASSSLFCQTEPAATHNGIPGTPSLPPSSHVGNINGTSLPSRDLATSCGASDVPAAPLMDNGGGGSSRRVQLGRVVGSQAVWKRALVAMERVRHVRREAKAVFSSELERCLLKATRPESNAVDEVYMQALLAQANRLAAVEACCDCDPHEVVCSKLFKKMMEGDWRTVAKALYVVHRLQRDSPPKEAARFSAFMKEKWADGTGPLGKHIRTDGGKHAPWLKVYCGYLATRGRRLETAMNAFRSWEKLTSTRQLRNALTETNALLARALALHFAADASAGGSGNDVRRACCALAFEDVADIRAMVCSTSNPPALLGVPGVVEEQSVPSPSSPEQSEPVAAAIAAPKEITAVCVEEGKGKGGNDADTESESEAEKTTSVVTGKEGGREEKECASKSESARGAVKDTENEKDEAEKQEGEIGEDIVVMAAEPRAEVADDEEFVGERLVGAATTAAVAEATPDEPGGVQPDGVVAEAPAVEVDVQAVCTDEPGKEKDEESMMRSVDEEREQSLSAKRSLDQGLPGEISATEVKTEAKAEEETETETETETEMTIETSVPADIEAASGSAVATQPDVAVEEKEVAVAEEGNVLNERDTNLDGAEIPEEVLEAARESAVYEDVSRVITAVYSARYGKYQLESAPVIPQWVRQMAGLARTVSAAATTAARQHEAHHVAGESRGTAGVGDSSNKAPVRGGWTVSGGRAEAVRRSVAAGRGLGARGGAGVFRPWSLMPMTLPTGTVGAGALGITRFRGGNVAGGSDGSRCVGAWWKRRV